jgi:hypothetical protein
MTWRLAIAQSHSGTRHVICELCAVERSRNVQLVEEEREVSMTSPRIFVAAAVLLMLALVSARANAGKGAKCVSKGTFVIKDGTDGSECRADSDGSNKATAKATGDSFAEAELETGGVANAVATNHGVAHATSNTGGNAQSKASNTSDASAVASSSGKATATASNNVNEDNDGGAGAVARAQCSATAKAKVWGCIRRSR